jgi:hypothetical protein
MTTINTAEYAKCGNLDRAIVWAISSLRAANNDGTNPYWLNEIFREEARGYLNWEVIPPKNPWEDATLVFVAKIPYENVSPFTSRNTWIEDINAYTSHTAPAIEIDTLPPHAGQLAPAIPAIVTSLEQLIAMLAANMAGILEYERRLALSGGQTIPPPPLPIGPATVADAYPYNAISLVGEPVAGLTITGGSSSPLAIYSGSPAWYKLPAIGQTQEATISTPSNISVIE